MPDAGQVRRCVSACRVILLTGHCTALAFEAANSREGGWQRFAAPYPQVRRGYTRFSRPALLLILLRKVQVRPTDLVAQGRLPPGRCNERSRGWVRGLG